MALGKNLENILGDYFGDSDVKLNDAPKPEVAAAVSSEITISLINSNPFQTRKHFSMEKIEALARSIQRSGLLNPITLLREKDGELTLLAGERRLRAFKFLKKKSIPAIIRDFGTLSEDDKFIISSAENLHRESLNSLELARTFDILLQKDNITIDKLAKSLGTTDQYIRNYLNLLRLSPKVIQALQENLLSEGRVRPLVPLEIPLQDKLLPIILAQNLSNREIQKLVKKALATPKKPAEWTHSLQPKYMSQINLLARQFPKSEVKLKGNEERGQIVIKWG